jgi:hypothetical protein
MTDYRSYNLSELDKIPAPRWMIPNVIREQSVAMLYGPTGVGKTFAALDIALSLAYGLEWAGNTGASHRQYRVAYFAGEACPSFRMRILAWHKFHNLPCESDNFVLFDGIPPIGTACGQDELCSMVYGHYDDGAELCIIDTAMRASAGIDLNSPSGSQALIDGCDAIRRQFDGSVLLIHHTGKNESRGPLGAENIKAAMDNLERIKHGPDKNGVKTVKLVQEKNKDGELRPEVHLALMTVEIPSSTGTTNLTTLVTAPAPVTSKSNLPTEGDISVRVAKEVLDRYPGRAFKVRNLAYEVCREMRNRNRGKKAAINSRKIEDKLRFAARSGEFGERAHKQGASNNAAWLFKSNDTLNDI